MRESTGGGLVRGGRRGLVVVLVATLAFATLLALAGPVTADAGWDEAVRRKLWDDADAAAHWDELVREVLWGWAPRTPAEDFVEGLRRAVWYDQDALAHWDEAVRRYLWDQAHPPTTSTTTTTTTTTTVVPSVPDSWKAMLASASQYEYHPGIWTISPTPCTCDRPGATVLGVTYLGTVILYPAAFTDQARLNYVVAHESGHLWAADHGIPADVLAAIDAIPDPAPDYERFADCYAQKKGVARPMFVGYWTCPASVLALITF